MGNENARPELADVADIRTHLAVSPLREQYHLGGADTGALHGGLHGRHQFILRHDAPVQLELRQPAGAPDEVVFAFVLLRASPIGRSCLGGDEGCKDTCFTRLILCGFTNWSDSSGKSRVISHQ